MLDKGWSYGRKRRIGRDRSCDPADQSFGSSPSYHLTIYSRRPFGFRFCVRCGPAHARLLELQDLRALSMGDTRQGREGKEARVAKRLEY
jgi:hypothetical protein